MSFHVVFLIKLIDESLILGASNMVDRYWSGTIWYHTNVVNFDRNQHAAAIKTESGVREAIYLGKHDKFIIGEDSGMLQIFEIVLNPTTHTQEMQCLGYSCQHDDSISSICRFENNDLIVTAGMDSWYSFLFVVNILCRSLYDMSIAVKCIIK